jgi:hypothetical protein
LLDLQKNRCMRKELKSSDLYLPTKHLTNPRPNIFSILSTQVYLVIYETGVEKQHLTKWCFTKSRVDKMALNPLVDFPSSPIVIKPWKEG